MTSERETQHEAIRYLLRHSREHLDKRTETDEDLRISVDYLLDAVAKLAAVVLEIDAKGGGE